MVKSFLIQLIFCMFGTALLIYSVIFYEPPAFIAYVFGILTGLGWCGVSFLYWLRHADEDEGDKHD